MITLSDRIYAHRAVMALHTLFGGAGHAIYEGTSIPGVITLTDRNFIVSAGDHERPLSVTALKPLALEHGVPVAATYVDPFKSGHRFQFDVVLLRDGGARLLERYRLWLPQIGSLHFVPDRGEDPCIEIGAQGLIEPDRPPFRSKAWKMLGIARGQAMLQHLIYGGTPFAAPNDRWLDY